MSIRKWFLMIGIVCMFLTKYQYVNAEDINNYTKIYNEFISTEYLFELSSTKTAIIFDFDNDGNDEMMTFFVSNENYEIMYNYEIFDIEEDVVICSSYIADAGYNISSENQEYIYISSDGFLVHRMYELGYRYRIVEYSNHKLEEIDMISFTDTDPDRARYFRRVDDKIEELSSRDYEILYEKYGVDDIEKLLMYDLDDSYAPDYDEIPFKKYEGSKKISNDFESNMNRLVFIIGNKSYTSNGNCFESDVAPIIENGRTLIPIRVVAEGLDADIKWIKETQTVIINKDSNKISIKVNQQLPNGMGTVRIINNRVFVPLRYISEQLGAYVTYDEKNKTITVIN